MLGRAGRAAIRGEVARAFDRSALKRLFGVNADIMVRTVALLILFGWFANAGARLGDVALAANHVLMQFVTVAAFVLDGFAFTAESRVGQAIGAQVDGRFPSRDPADRRIFAGERARVRAWHRARRTAARRIDDQ